ncbi:MAG: hypothetical protein ACM3N7_03300 [Planctomycetaceae bacterium]
MNLKAKVYVENRKKKIQEELSARLARLKEQGVKEETIQKDATVRRMRAQVRKMDDRLAAISAQEKLNQERAQAKIDKLAAEKAAKEAPIEEAEKKEPEKKEKKAKKEKAEKPPRPEGTAAGKSEEKAELAPPKPKEKKETKEKPQKAEKKPKKADP